MRSNRICVSWLLVAAGCAAEGGGVFEDPDLARSGESLPSWEEFFEGVHRDADGVWIVDGDTPIDTEKRLVDFYEQLVAPDALTVVRVDGRDSIWSSTQKRSLTYCVSTGFGSRHATVVRAMADAAAAWEAIADVDFVHVSAEDGRCNASNTAVLFDVRPTSGQPYLARAFFPYQGRSTRNVLVDSSAYAPGGSLTLTGILRHELGHALGFRHEHTRPEARACYEDSAWRAVTPYDRESVMHYPQCNGVRGDLTISALDAQGAAALYGPPRGGGPAPTPTPTPSGTQKSGTASGTVTAGQSVRYRAFSVAPGSTFLARLRGTGDADLYVAWDQAPTSTAYACRPYSADSAETCELRVPSGARTANVMVHGFTDASYTLEVRWVEPRAAELREGGMAVRPSRASHANAARSSRRRAATAPHAPARCAAYATCSPGSSIGRRRSATPRWRSATTSARRAR